MWAFPGKQLVFMGCEFGQRPEWTENDSLEWWVADLEGHRGLQRMFADLNDVYRSHPALWKLDSSPEGFRWIDADDVGGNTFSWLRSDGAGQQIAVAVNFASEPWTQHRIGLTEPGVWTEIFNSDLAVYDGTGVHDNGGRITAHAEEYHGFPASATVVIPPLGAVFFRHEAEKAEPSEAKKAKKKEKKAKKAGPA
jgi:1,4-alpha-glucan branching enzyme